MWWYPDDTMGPKWSPRDSHNTGSRAGARRDPRAAARLWTIQDEFVLTDCALRVFDEVTKVTY